MAQNKDAKGGEPPRAARQYQNPSLNLFCCNAVIKDKVPTTLHKYVSRNCYLPEAKAYLNRLAKS